MPTTPVPLVIHERVANWTRQIRPHAASWPVRLVETRSGPEFRAAVARHGPSVAVVGLGNDPSGELMALHQAIESAPQLLSLVLEPAGRPGVVDLAREAGATMAYGTWEPPPRIIRLLRRLVDRAVVLQAACGWLDESFHPSPDDLDAWLRTL
jgi:hypothetical protein